MSGPGDYVKLYRSIRDSGILEDGPMLQVFTKALLDTAYSHVRRTLGRQTVALAPGEFIFGRNRWAKELNLSPKVVRNRIAKLEKRATIGATHKANEYTVYSFMNWEYYAGCMDLSGHGVGPSVGPTTGQPEANHGPHKEEIKEVKKRKEDTHVSSCTEHPNGSEPQIIITLPLKDGTEFAITEEFAQELGQLYRVPDLMQSFRRMRGWLIGNPARKKTSKGIKRFITNWLSREIDDAQRPGGGKVISMPRHTQNNLAVIDKLLEED